MRALRGAMVVLVTLAAWVAVCPVLAQAPISNVNECVLPPRYAFSALVADLRGAGIPYSPAAVAQAHARYADAVDATLPACLPFLLQVVQGSQMSYGVRLSDAELVKMHAHQERLAAIAEQAERALFDELALSPLLARDEDKSALAALRARRELDRIINAVQRRCAVLGPEHAPDAVGSSRGYAGAMQRLPPETLKRVTEAMDSQQAMRLKAWRAVMPAVDAAVADTIALQREAPDSGPNSYSKPPVAPIAGPAQARLLRAEIDTLRAIAQRVPEVAVMMAVAEAQMVDLHPSSAEVEPSSALPSFPSHPFSTVTTVANSVARLPQWDEATRAKLRPILAAWVREDAALIPRQTDEFLRALEAEDLHTYRSTPSAASAARVALAGTTLAELRDITNAEWLSAGGIIPFDAANQAPLHPDDARDFGAPYEAPPIPDMLPTRAAPFMARRMPATQGMTPAPWRVEDRRDVIEALQLNAAQHAVANQILDDAAAQWMATVEPLASTLRVLQHRSTQMATNDAASKAAHFRNVETEFKTRRDAWAASRAIDDHIFRSLSSALGSTPAAGHDTLQVIHLKRLRDTAAEGCLVMIHAMNDASRPDVVTVALTFRGTAAERETVLHAIAVHAPDFHAVRSKELDNALLVQEAADRWKRKSVEHQVTMEDAARRGISPPTAFPTIESAFDVAGDALAYAQRFDTELYGRVEATLPEPLADRLRRCIQVEHATPQLTWLSHAWLGVSYALEHGYPDAVPTVHAAFTASLDPWAAWAEPIVLDINRALPPSSDIQVGNANSARTKRTAALNALLTPSLQDRVNHANAHIADAIPPEIARRSHQLRQYCPPPPVTTAPTPTLTPSQ